MPPAPNAVEQPPAPGDPPFIGKDPAPWERQAWTWRAHLLPIGLASFVLVSVISGAACWELAARAGCGGRIVCVINNNGGLSTLYGLLLTVVGLALTLLLRSLDDESERERFIRVRRQAVYEAWHNLQHFASSWRKLGHLKNRADITLDRASELAIDPLAKWLSPSQAEHVDHMRRNFAVLQRLEWNDESTDARNHVRWFIEQALRFVIDVAREDAVARAMFTHFHVRDGVSEAGVMRPLRRMAQAIERDDRRWAVRFEFAIPLEDADAANCHVVCWKHTATARGPEIVHVLGASLAGLRDPP